MMSPRCRKRIHLTAVALLLGMPYRSASPQPTIIELTFSPSAISTSDTTRTLESLLKVQGTGGLCQDGLYLITQYGNREELFAGANEDAMKNPLKNHTWRYCSVFACGTDSGFYMGRNWDNQNVGSIIVSLYHPPGGYASLSFARAIDMGFPLNLDLEQIKSSELGNALLLAPFYAVDGINEHGLAVAVAGVKEVKHSSARGRERVYVSYLIRKLLDQARTVDEAARLAERFIPFDLDSNSLNGHFMIADATGRSAILEYDEDTCRVVRPDTSWQVLTTRPIHAVPDSVLRGKCWRYRGISEALEARQGADDRESAMGILRNVSQEGTTWSIVYALKTRDLHFCVYRNWDTVYRIGGVWTAGDWTPSE